MRLHSLPGSSDPQTIHSQAHCQAPEKSHLQQKHAEATDTDYRRRGRRDQRPGKLFSSWPGPVLRLARGLFCGRPSSSRLPSLKMPENLPFMDM